MEIEAKIEKLGIVPVVVLENAKDAGWVADALCDGNLPCAEVTFRTAAAKEAIKVMRKSRPEMLVGAGTVLTKEQVDDAVEAGAQFIVSPGFDGEIVDYCIAKGVPVFPGCVTPSELAQAVKRNLKVVKFFPAEKFGGIKTIGTLAAAYTNLRFMPTGGIHQENLGEYLSSEKIIACGGSWMVKGELIRNHDQEKIKQLSLAAVKKVKEIRG